MGGGSANVESALEALERADALLRDDFRSREKVHALAVALEAEGITFAWQLMCLESADWKEFGAPLCLRTAVQTVLMELDAGSSRSQQAASALQRSEAVTHSVPSLCETDFGLPHARWTHARWVPAAEGAHRTAAHRPLELTDRTRQFLLLPNRNHA